MNRKIIILLLLLSSILLGGCWDRVEMSERAIILGTGVDLTEDNQLRLTVQIAKPANFAAGTEGARGQTGAPTWIVSAEGNTILEAERNLATIVSRKIYWGHNIILVIGGKLAKQEGTRKVTNYFQRSSEPRETMWVMVTPGEAKDVLEVSSELEKSSAQEAGFLARMKRGASVNLKEFAEMLSSKGIEPIATRVDVISDGISPTPGTTSNPIKTVAVSGTALFKEDRLVGWLNNSETRGLLWLKGKIIKGVITVPSPEEPGENVSFTVVWENTKIEPEYDGENLSFNVIINMKGDLLEQQSRENLATEDKKTALEKEIAEDIWVKVNETLEKVRDEYGVDVFGFGQAFHRKYKKEWPELEDRWNEEFSRASVNVQVEADIRGLGLLSKRASVPIE